MPKPIFVVGSPRSGTTWLANILCQHSKIAGVQAEEHFGIVESAYFSHVETYFGDLKDDNNFIMFVETFGSSDYFRLTGLNKDLLYHHRPKTYVNAFRLIMDTFAEKKNASYWLEKSPGHTLYIKKIARYFPNAKFVGIKRNVVNMVKSTVRRNVFKNNFSKKIFIIKRTWRYFKYLKHLYNFAFKSDKNTIKIIQYEDLKKNPVKTLEKVCEFLNLDFEPNLLEQKYKPNTSFTNFNNKQERESILTKFEVSLVKKLAFIFKSIPYWVFRVFYYFQVNLRQNKLPPWYWGIYKKEKFSIK
ncbi:MAG: sulfotransferase family protein [Promethearchaeota archaeon]